MGEEIRIVKIQRTAGAGLDAGLAFDAGTNHAAFGLKVYASHRADALAFTAAIAALLLYFGGRLKEFCRLAVCP